MLSVALVPYYQLEKIQSCLPYLKKFEDIQEDFLSERRQLFPRRCFKFHAHIYFIFFWQMGYNIEFSFQKQNLIKNRGPASSSASWMYHICRSSGDIQRNNGRRLTHLRNYTVFLSSGLGTTRDSSLKSWKILTGGTCGISCSACWM